MCWAMVDSLDKSDARLSHAVSLLALGFFSLAPGVHGETGKEGWLRYAPLPKQVAQQYRLPRHIVVMGQSAVARSAASELARGLHSMLSENVQLESALSADDSFVLGTVAGDSAFAARLEAGISDCARRLFPLPVFRAGPQLLGARRRDGSRRTLRRFPDPGAGCTTKAHGGRHGSSFFAYSLG